VSFVQCGSDAWGGGWGGGNEISHVVSGGWYGYMNSVNILF